MLEIERKFLVRSDHFKSEAFEHEQIEQGYLNSNPARSVRVRKKGNSGFLTIKGKSRDGGVSRFEWEKEISSEETDALLALCEPGKIRKTRYKIKSDDHIFEVDEFHGENEGLIIAEIELTSADEDFQKPEWLGEEVTGKKEYYNAYLSKNPFKTRQNN